MNGSFVEALLEGARISLTADCFPLKGKVETVRVSMTEATGNGTVTLNGSLTVTGKSREQVEAEIAETVREMQRCIFSPREWKG